MTLSILARGVDYYVDISVFSEVAARLCLSFVFRSIGDVNANPKQEAVIGRFGRIAKWEKRKTKDKKGGKETRNLKECSCLMMFKKGL